MASILDARSLIKTIRRRAFIPRSQETFTDEDFLEMATEEINIGLMDQLIEARGDYLVYYKDIPLSGASYDIPYRAHGNKLRDVSIVDSSGNTIYELSQVSLDELVDFQSAYVFNVPNCFYIQNNKVYLTSQAFNDTYFLRMYFYMRPNQLVLNERAGKISQMLSTVEIDNIDAKTGTISNIASGSPTIITSSSHGLTSSETQIIISGSNSTPSIDGLQTISIIDENSFSIEINVTVPGNAGTWNKAVPVITYTVDVLPKVFTQSNRYDTVGGLSPNKIKTWDMPCNAINVLGKTITFRASDCEEIVAGDYISFAEETIIPNVPTEYHPVVAQRVAVACLEAMGDEQNKQSAERKLAQMEKAALKIITNRVEGAPRKIKQRHGALNQSIGNSFYRRG